MVREPQVGVGVRSCMFPALPRSFWKGLMSEAHDKVVYITDGLSATAMPAPDEQDPSRVELFATCDQPIGGGPSGAEDLPTQIFQDIAEYIVSRGAFVGIGHTLDFASRWAANSAMRGLLFSTAIGVDEKRIAKCSAAKALLTPVPITGAELDFCRREGVLALLDRFEDAGVEPVFDVFRKSSI